jgi:hypothetical protein
MKIFRNFSIPVSCQMILWGAARTTDEECLVLGRPLVSSPNLLAFCPLLRDALFISESCLVRPEENKLSLLPLASF